MMTPLCFSLIAAFLDCAPFAAPGDDDVKLREDLVKARLEILDLKLQIARLSSRADEEIRILEEALRSDIPEVGIAGLRELSKLPEERRRTALPTVLARFSSAPEAVRAQAVAFLGHLLSADAEAVVVRAAADPAPAVRLAAASALKTSTSPPAIAALTALLRDQDAGVRKAVLEALGVAKREAAVTPILDLLATESEPEVREKGVDALGTIGSAAAVVPLLELLSGAGTPGLRWSCINSLGQIGDPRAAPGLRPYLDAARTVALRQVTIEALGRLRDASSITAIAKILRSDPEERLRERAAAAVGLIAGAEGSEEDLLRAYFEDASDLVRRAAWAALAGAAGDRLDANERLILALLGKQKRGEADAICARLHTIKPDEAARARALALEEKVAGAAFDAGDAKAALPHYRQMLALAPERSDILRRIAACFRELKDSESRVKTLRDLEAKLAKGEPAWWEIRLETLSVLETSRDAEAAAEDAAALLAMTPPLHPEERRRTLEKSLRAATLRLIQPLVEQDATSRSMALDATRRLGKRILPTLAAEAEAAKGPLPAVVEAANAIVQGTLEPGTADVIKLREAAAVWRQWAARN